MTDRAGDMQAAMRGFFGELLGITILSATPDRVVGELLVRDDLCTIPGVMHGGAVMALADQLGAMGTVLNLDVAKGYGTTTIESKTNFLSAGRAGTKVTAECVPLHRGGRLMTWQTTVRGEDGKVVSITTQTQMVLEPRRSEKEQIAGLLGGKSPGEREALLREALGE